MKKCRTRSVGSWLQRSAWSLKSRAGKSLVWKRFRLEEEGSTLIELTLLIPVLFVIVLSGIELGFYIQRSMLVMEAASVGARFGIIAGNASNTAGMTQAARAEAEGMSGFTAVASTFCSCTPGGSKTTCSTTCSTGYQASHYVQVTTSATVPGIFNVTGLPKSMSPSATSIMRASWPGQ